MTEQDLLYLPAQTRVLSLMQHEGGYWCVDDLFKRVKYARHTIKLALNALYKNGLVEVHCDPTLLDMRLKFWRARE